MATKNQTESNITIKPPTIITAEFCIVGTSPYVQHRFSKKGEMMAKQAAGGTARSKKVREAKDFDAVYEAAKHVSSKGWVGIPAPSFRNAMISACRLVGFKMTLAKMSAFVKADGFDADDGQPLVRIYGKPERHDMAARNATGVVDIRTRPMWREWGAVVRIQYDSDQFTASDIANLLQRAGMQVGVGEGRHDSKQSAGLGWGCFEITNENPEDMIQRLEG